MSPGGVRKHCIEFDDNWWKTTFLVLIIVSFLSTRFKMSILQPLEDLSANIVTLVFNIYNFEHLDGSYTSDLKEHNGIYW